MSLSPSPQDEDRTPIEWVRDGADAVSGVYLTVVMVFVTLALLITGNTLARVIGVFFLLVLLVLAARRPRLSHAFPFQLPNPQQMRLPTRPNS